MKTSIKPSLLILLSLVLSFAGMVLPATRIQYQVTLNASQTTLNKEGYESAISTDKYGRGAISCINPRLASLPGKGFVTLLGAWRVIGFMLIYVPFLFASNYFTARKMTLGKFFVWTAGIGAAFILLVWVTMKLRPEPVQPLCNFDDLYRVVSFMPNWLFIPLPAVAILLGYFGTRHKSNNESAVVAST